MSDTRDHTRPTSYHGPLSKQAGMNYSTREDLRLIKPDKNYVPTVLRSLSFAVIFACTLALIGLIEYGCHTLPYAPWELPKIKDLANDLTKRQNITDPGPASLDSVVDPVVTSTVATNPYAYLNPDVQTTNSPVTPSALPPTAYLDPTVQTTKLPVVSALPPSAYLDPSIDSSIEPSTSGGAYINSGVSILTVPVGSGGLPTEGPTYPGAPAPTQYLNPGVSSSSSPAPAVSTSLSPSTSFGPVTSTNTDATKSAGSTPSTSTITSSATLPLSQPIVGPIASTTSTSAVSLASKTGFLDPKYSGKALSTTKDVPLVVLTPTRYFIGTYLAVLLAVLLRITYGWLYSTIKMLEPFYYLARPEGARPKDFFNINFLSTNDSFEPFKAMLNGHWLMLWTSLLYLVVGLLTPFASELLHFYRYCESDGSGPVVCAPVMWINPSVARILEALLAFVAVMLVNVWSLQRKQKNSIYSDPSSIASIASLLHNPDVVRDFQSLPPHATKDQMVKNLSDRQYRLETYQAFDGVERYGMIVTGTNDVASRGGTFEIQNNSYQGVPTSDHYNHPPQYVSKAPKSGKYKVLKLVRDIVFSLVTAGMLVIVAYYYKVGTNTGFQRFMNGQGFGPKFLITCVGVIIHSEWKRLEREHAINEPWRRLHAGNASPESSILVERTLIPLTTFFYSLYRNSYLVAHVAFIAIAAEILIIVLPGVPFSDGQLYEAFVVSSFVCIAILALMLISIVVVWTRSKGPQLPRAPSTIAAMCLYLCDSSMLEDFADLSTLERKARNRHVANMGREYKLGYGRGSDGRERWCVDYESHGRVNMVVSP